MCSALLRPKFILFLFSVLLLFSGVDLVIENSCVLTFESKDKYRMNDLSNALRTYHLDMGEYPRNLKQLVIHESENWFGPYVKAKELMNPWGSEYLYQSSNETFQLLSLGSDNQFGGEDYAKDKVILFVND
jgi:hypothetical protein